jgi:arylsulfatase A-like enzyme
MPVSAADAPPSDQPQNVILMGWDGCHRDHVKALLKEGKLPNLKTLIAEGALVDIDVTSGATDTKAGWTQILTGYKPAVTGVFNNGRFRDVPAGYSLFERLKVHFGADTFAMLAVIGKKQHCGEIDAPFKRLYEPAKDNADTATATKAGPKQPGAGKPNRGRIVEEDGKQYLVFDGSPYFTMHKSCDEWQFGLMQDEKVGTKSLELLDKYKDKPFFFFIHLAEVDHKGHQFGEPSKEYNDAIISGDTQLGRVVEKLKALGLYDKTKIYITADHGFNIGAKGHSYAPYIFLATNDKKVMRDGTRADIAPTILDRFGLDLSTITPPLNGEPLTKPATRPVEKAPATPPAGRARRKAGGTQANARPGAEPAAV